MMRKSCEGQRRLAVILLFALLLVTIALLSNERHAQPLIDIDVPDLSNISGCGNLSWCTLARQAIEEQANSPVSSTHRDIPANVQKHIDEITQIRSQPDFDYNMTSTETNITALLDLLEDLVKTHNNANAVTDHDNAMPEDVKNLLIDVRNLLIGNLRPDNGTIHPILSSLASPGSQRVQKIDELLRLISPPNRVMSHKSPLE
jgi:hypothetical protein